MHQVPVVLEDHGGLLQHPSAFDIDGVIRVYQYVVDRGVLNQRLQRTEPEDFIQNFLRQAVSFPTRQRNILFPDQLMNHAQKLLLRRRILVHLGDLFEIHALDEFLVDGSLNGLLHFERNRSRPAHDGGDDRGVPIDSRFCHREILSISIALPYFHSANRFLTGSGSAGWAAPINVPAHFFICREKSDLLSGATGSPILMDWTSWL